MINIPASDRLAVLAKVGAVVVFVVTFLVVVLRFAASITAAPEADCSNGNFAGTYQTSDTILSGDLYVTGNVTIRNNVTLTITASSSVTLCGEYKIHVTGGADLIAVGTATEPITFVANDPATNWDTISFVNQGEHSILRFVTLNDGGGNDPFADNAPIYILNNLGTTVLPSPSIDNATINDSGAYGISISMLDEDPTPPSITNISINNSANAAILADAEALGGLGQTNSFTNNQPNVIQIRSGGNRLRYNQHWSNPGVPIEVLGDFTVAAEATDAPAILTIDPGVTFLMYPQTNVLIGSSSNRRGSLVINGTEATPVTFTRLDDVSAPWGQMGASLYPDTAVTLEYVNFSYGGSGVAGMLYHLGSGAVNLDHVSLQNSLTAGFYGHSGQATINNSRFELNVIGLESNSGYSAIMRNSTIANNVTAGVYVTDNGSQTCIDALGNYWGADDGPVDGDGGSDACDNGRTNGGGGSSISNGVRYDPWLTGVGSILDRGQIIPDKFYIIADSVDTANVEITLRDAQGNPMSGKQVLLNTTTGFVQQPPALTDSAGKATATITGTTSGYAYLTAYNVTDENPVAGIGGVTFWQGSGDAGGLISADGTPYASPELIISGKPFQVGFPVGMRIPMQNANVQPVDVTVVYGVSGLSVGTLFEPVYTATQTLQPGDQWDASGVWLPVSSGHRCIQAAIAVDDGQVQQYTQRSSNLSLQHNTNQNPCDPDVLDPGRALPKSPGSNPLLTVAYTFVKLHHLAKLANQCINETLGSSSHNMNGGRDYEVVVTPETFTPPTIPAGGDLTQDQAAALNEIAETSTVLLSLNRALGATAQRMNWASQAVNIAGRSGDKSYLQSTSSLYYLDLQYAAYRDFANQYADKLDEFSSEIDVLLAASPGADALYFLPEDFQNTRDVIGATGFDADTEFYYQQTGLSDGLISQLENDIVADFDRGTFEIISWSWLLNDIQADAAAIANRLRGQYPLQRGMRANQSLATVLVRPVIFQFDVGHPFSSTHDVELVVKPVNLPLDWTYELNSDSFTLDSDEFAEATLTLYPSDKMLEGDLIQVAVEGYVDGVLVGGILMEHNAPHLTPLLNLYLPVIIR